MLNARNIRSLPQKIPLLPLNGVVLMPFGHLPLNIFEPRYVNMIDDVIGNLRVIGMIQPRAPEPDPVADNAPLYDVGTAGRIIQFQDTGDGRYLITLEGLARFRIMHEIDPDPARGYRTADIDFNAYQTDLSPSKTGDAPEHGRILELMREYFTGKDINTDWDAVSDAPYEALISSLTMTCPFAPEEKQALLQCRSHEDRARMLISLFEINLGGMSPSALKH